MLRPSDRDRLDNLPGAQPRGSLATGENQSGRKVEEHGLRANTREVPSQELAFLESPELPVGQIREGSERCHVLELDHDAGRGHASFRLPNNPRAVLRSH